MAIDHPAHRFLGGYLFGFCFLISVSSAGAANFKVFITFADFSERTGLVFVAKDQRLFEQQGIDAEIVQVRSGPVAISALAANDAQFYSAPASGATIGAMAGGLDLAFVAGIIGKLDGYFVTSPKIKAVADLKGKTLGVQSMGGGIWMFTMMALDHWGLNPERDKIQFRVIGDQSVIAQAMATGIIDGALLGFSFSKVVQKNGGHLLADLTKANVPYQHQGLLARKSFVDASPDVVERTLRSLSKAIVFIQDPTNKQAVTRTLAKWLRLSPNEGADDLYERMRNLYERRIAPTREGLQNALRVLGRITPKVATLKADDLIYDRIARKLDAEGF